MGKLAEAEKILLEAVEKAEAFKVEWKDKYSPTIRQFKAEAYDKLWKLLMEGEEEE